MAKKEYLATRQANLDHMLRAHSSTGVPDLGPGDPLTIMSPLLDAFDRLRWQVKDLEKWFPNPGKTHCEGVTRWPFASGHDKPESMHQADDRWLFLHAASDLDMILEEGNFSHCSSKNDDDKESDASQGIRGIGTSLSMNLQGNAVSARQLGLRMTRRKKNVLGFAFEAYWLGPKTSIASKEAEEGARRKNSRCVTKLGASYCFPRQAPVTALWLVKLGTREPSLVDHLA